MNFHGYLGRPLQRYLDDERVVASDESVTVDQIDFLIAKPTDRPCDGFIGLECTMIFLGFGPTEAIAPDLHLSERIELDQFTIERYDTDGPLTVSVEDLVPPNDLRYSSCSSPRPDPDGSTRAGRDVPTARRGRGAGRG